MFKRTPTNVSLGLLTHKEHDREVRRLVEVMVSPNSSMAEKGDALAKLDVLTRA